MFPSLSKTNGESQQKVKRSIVFEQPVTVTIKPDILLRPKRKYSNFDRQVAVRNWQLTDTNIKSLVEIINNLVCKQSLLSALLAKRNHQLSCFI